MPARPRTARRWWRADGHRGGGGRHADRHLGRPDGPLHAPGGRHLGQQRDGDGAAGTTWPDIHAQGTFDVTARLTDAVGNAAPTHRPASVTVDTAAPTAPSITSIAENGGGGINAGEASNGTPVVVGLTGTGAVAGDTLTINWGSQTVTYTLLAGDISASSATVTVPAATITAQGNGTFNVTARLTDAVGNASANSSATSVTVDTVAPTAAVAITAIATDSGTSSNDYVTSDTTLTVSGMHGLLGPGEKVQVSSDGGASWVDATTSTASTWSYTDPTPHATSLTYQVRIVDTVGNVGTNTDSQAVTIDTAAPTAPSITSIAENSGGGINAGEAANGTPVVVGLTGTGAAAGDTLTVTWGSQTVTYTLLAGDISASSATVTVPAGTITAQGQGTFDVTARLTDVAGNAGAKLIAHVGDGRHGGADGAVDHLDHRKQRRRHRCRRGLERHAGGGQPDGHRGGGGRHADRQLGRPDGHLHAPGGRHLGRQRDGDGASATITAQGNGTFNVTARLADATGNVSANSGAFTVTVDTVAPTAPSITSIAENSGGGINAGEAADGTPVVVGLTGTGAAAGDTLTVTWGSQTVTYTLLAADISGSSATVTVPAGTITAQGNGTFNVTARLTDAVGNAGSTRRQRR